MKRLVIGTRGSSLARWQTHYVRDVLLAAHDGLEIDVKTIVTRGDKSRKTPLYELARGESPQMPSSKGLFTKELEGALLDGRADLAVHSLKDLPTELPPGLALGAVPVREDPADALVAKDGMTLEMIPRGSTVLAGSLRRAAQLLHIRGDLEVAPVRGNVETRLWKLQQSDAKAIILARAGLVRLGLADRITQRLEPEEFLPACGQGALGVEIRADDYEVAELVAAIDDRAARATTTAERAALARLGGGCHVPVGAYARLGEDGVALNLTGIVASLDGLLMVRASESGEMTGEASAEELGWQLAETLLANGAEKMLEGLM